MRLFYEVRQTNIIIYEYSCGRSRAKKINSALKIAAVRGEVDDLPARCISLLQEVKDLIKAYNSGHENADETAAFTLSERQARPSCTVQQHQGNATHRRVMQNFRSLCAPYSATCSSSASTRP